MKQFTREIVRTAILMAIIIFISTIVLIFAFTANS